MLVYIEAAAAGKPGARPFVDELRRYAASLLRSVFMVETIGGISDLAGRVCEDLKLQQYFHQGELADPANVLFLKPEGMPWQRVFFDSGILFWREIAEPDTPETSPGDEHHYLLVDIGAPHQLVGRRVERVQAIDAGPVTQLHIDFANGAGLTLENDAYDESRIFVHRTE